MDVETTRLSHVLIECELLLHFQINLFFPSFVKYGIVVPNVLESVPSVHSIDRPVVASIACVVELNKFKGWALW